MILQDKSGGTWTAIAHSNDYPGPNGRIPAVSGTINGQATDLCFGSARGTRINFEYAGRWWLITQCDQPERNGTKPNLYDHVRKARAERKSLQFTVVA